MKVTVDHISEFFEHWAPFSTQAEYDNSGLLIGSPTLTVSGILTCLDVTEAVVDEALSLKCNLIVAHHPLIFRKIARINPDTSQGSLLYKLIQNNIAVLAVHTNLDAASNGVSFVLGDVLGLQNAQFLHFHDADKTHGYGVIGQLDKPLEKSAFLKHVSQRLNTPSIRFSGDVDVVKTVAVCGGTGVSLASKAQRSGADAYITADIKYHEYFDIDKMLLVDAGHYETESPIIQHLQRKLSIAFETVTVKATSVVTNPMQSFINPDFFK